MVDFSKKRHLVLMAVLLAVLALTACGGGEEEPTPLARPSVAIENTPTLPDEPVVITIGNLSDLTGAGATAMEYVNMALADLVEYYNEENLIPGVKLEIKTFDSQWDPSRDIPGYEWLKQRGADLIFTTIPDAPLTLKSIVDKENMPLFAASGYQDMLDPPGYVFVMGTIPEHQAYTILNWIAENDWDYKSNGPAKIGGASWLDGYSQSFIAAMEKYAQAHPDQFEWVGGYLADFKFTWAPEVEALKDCDYVFPCVAPVAFMKEYRSTGYTAKFIGTDVHTVFFSLISDAQLWDEIDGSPFIKGGSLWWNEEGELINLTRELLHENHPDEAEKVIRAGGSYLAVAGIFYPMLEIIADAVEAVGVEDINSQAIYDAAISYSLEIDGVERAGFTETRRYALSNYQIYRASAADEDITRADENWIPHLVEP